SDFEYVCFLLREPLIDVVVLALRAVVEFGDGTGDFVLAGLSVLLDPLETVLGVAADVAYGDLSVLVLALDDLDVFLAALLGQFRQDDADDVAVVGRVRPEVGVA